MTQDRPVRVVLAHAEPLVRAGMRAALAVTDVDVVAEVCSAAALLEVLTDESADVVVLDLDLDGPRSGLGVCSEVVEHPAAPRVLMMLARTQDSDVADAAAALAAGLVSTRVEAGDFVRSVLDVAAGRNPVSADLSAGLLALARGGPARSRNALSPREVEVLRLAAAGKSNRQIGEALFLSENTIKSHLSRINEKLGVSGRTEAVARAVREGILERG